MVIGEGKRWNDHMVTLQPSEFVLAVVETEPPEDPKPPSTRHRRRLNGNVIRFESADA